MLSFPTDAVLKSSVLAFMVANAKRQAVAAALSAGTIAVKHSAILVAKTSATFAKSGAHSLFSGIARVLHGVLRGPLVAKPPSRP